MQVFLDANVLFSAAYREGSPATLLFDLAQAGYCHLCASDLAITEAQRNIALKARARSSALEALLDQLSRTGTPDAAAVSLAARSGLPAKDIPILAAAIHMQAELFVTGDITHFGQLFGKRVGNVLVVRLARALELIVEEAG